MFKYGTLPQLNNSNQQQNVESSSKRETRANLRQDSRHSSLFSTQNSSSIDSSSSASSSEHSSIGGRFESKQQQDEAARDQGPLKRAIELSKGRRLASSETDCVLLFNLPPTINNSALVRQRVSAKDCLAAAAVSTGASLPLMIGSRSRCVVNLIERPSELRADQSSVAAAVAMVPSTQSGPKNTALRAEQRRQHMVSVVRPVVKAQQEEDELLALAGDIMVDKSARSRAASRTSSVIEDFMSLDDRLNPRGGLGLELDDLLRGCNGGIDGGKDRTEDRLMSEQQIRQQVILLRREDYELSRGIKRQHKFVLKKIEERKRSLQTIQSVWFQRDFKRAIEKLVDFYNQGLMFSFNSNHKEPNKVKGGERGHLRVADSESDRGTKLSSLNTSLVVDVLGVILSRPKLWNLEICQLLLPIIIEDLLVQATPEYEFYVEVGLKSLKLILTHFSPIIKTTLESQKESAKLVGIDLSREDRINKCLNCYKLLLEAARVLMRRQQTRQTVNKESGRLNSMYKELNQMLSAFRASIEPNQVASFPRKD